MLSHERVEQASLPPLAGEPGPHRGPPRAAEDIGCAVRRHAEGGFKLTEDDIEAWTKWAHRDGRVQGGDRSPGLG